MIFEFIFQSLPYFFLLIFCFFVFKISNQRKASYYLFFILFLFSALRYDVGWDYWNYRIAIEDNDYYNIVRYEWLEQQLAFLCQKLNFPQLFFIVNSYLTFLFLYLGINKQSTNYSISYLTYLCIPIFFFSGFAVVRFSLALSVIFWAYSFLLDKKPLHFIFVLIVTFFIHKSSLIALLLIPLYYFPLNRTINIGVFVASLFISSTNVISSLLNNNFLMAMSVADDFKNYAEGGEDFGGFHKLPLLFCFINGFNLLFYEKLLNNKEDDEKKKLSFYISVYNIGCCIMLFFADNATLSSRLSAYFEISMVLILALYIQTKDVKFNVTTKSIINIILITLFIFQLTINNYNGDDLNRWSTFLPYRIFLLN